MVEAEWKEYVDTKDSKESAADWAQWVRSQEGIKWCNDKRREAKTFVEWMIQLWGRHVLAAGEGVIDVGGDPGFVAAELVRSGIRVTLVDPVFGNSGKADAYTTAALRNPRLPSRFQAARLDACNRCIPMFRVIKRPFDQNFVDDTSHTKLLKGASALIALYPDEATDFLLHTSAVLQIRMAFIPCNDCTQFFPPSNPTYQGFVNELLAEDKRKLKEFSGGVPLRRDRLWGSPFCQVVLQRSPMSGHAIA